MKKFILLALLATVVVVGGYLAYTTWVSPRPAVVADTAAPADTSAVQPAMSTTLPPPTIVTAQLNKDGIPEQIGTLSLKSSKIGADALSEFEAMHGGSLNLKTGYRADYVDGTASAILWVGQAQSATDAQALVKDMADKIGSGNPMFNNLTPLSIGSRTIYEAEGQGQLHFFYVVNDKIVWLASDGDHATGALHSLWGAIQ